LIEKEKRSVGGKDRREVSREEREENVGPSNIWQKKGNSVARQVQLNVSIGHRERNRLGETEKKR